MAREAENVTIGPSAATLRFQLTRIGGSGAIDLRGTRQPLAERCHHECRDAVETATAAQLVGSLLIGPASRWSHRPDNSSLEMSLTVKRSSMIARSIK